MNKLLAALFLGSFVLGLTYLIVLDDKAKAQFPAKIPAGMPAPLGSTPITVSATGTTAATTATLAASTIGQNTYLCGFSIRANATAAANVQASVTGIIGGTMTYQQWVGALASNIGVVEETFTPCEPSSAANTAIAVASGAAGSGGNVTVNVWGYQY
jgi:hypothetical protein